VCTLQGDTSDLGDPELAHSFRGIIVESWNPRSRDPSPRSTDRAVEAHSDPSHWEPFSQLRSRKGPLEARTIGSTAAESIGEDSRTGVPYRFGQGLGRGDSDRTTGGTGPQGVAIPRVDEGEVESNEEDAAWV
jgi:hypothetical protein